MNINKIIFNDDGAALLSFKESKRDEEFNLFSHDLLLKEGKPLIFSYDALKMGILELYLSVKIRNDDDINNYDEQAFEMEKLELQDCDGFALIENIKNCVETLMNMKEQQRQQIERTNHMFFGDQFIDRHKDSEHMQFPHKVINRGGTHQRIDSKAIDVDIEQVRPVSHRLSTLQIKTTLDDKNKVDTI